MATFQQGRRAGNPSRRLKPGKAARAAGVGVARVSRVAATGTIRHYGPGVSGIGRVASGHNNAGETHGNRARHLAPEAAAGRQPSSRSSATMEGPMLVIAGPGLGQDRAASSSGQSTYC